MYLHSATFSASSNGYDGKPQKINVSPMHRSVNREIVNATIVRNTMKDPTSSKLQIKGPKQADALHFVETRILRRQLQSFPEGLHEDARRNYLLNQNDKRKSLQDFQCNVLVKLENVLKEKIVLNGEDVRKYRVGGHDGGTYEIFFRVEPKRFMSEAQLMTALRLAFGSEVIKSELVVKKIFSSFDFFLRDEMDWRSFLYLLIILMQPTLTTAEMIKHAYALYSSVGILDMTCSEKVKIGAIKDFICAPVQLSKRSYIINEFDRAWQNLQNEDGTVLQYAAKRTEIMKAQNSDFDPNEFPIPFSFLQKILNNTSFNHLIQQAAPYGKRDSRTWSTHLEEEFYHPLLVQRLKALRRELRNEDEANKFIALSDTRRKKFSVQIWQLFVRRRIFLRHILVAYELRSTVMVYGIFLDKWKKVCMEYASALTIQRVLRGFLARRRRNFIKRLQQKVVRLQKHSRQFMVNKKVKQGKVRLNWAASTIQRIFRGRKVRRMAATMIEAYFDTQKRTFQKERERWELSRLVKASIAIQMAMRRFLRRRRTMRRIAQKELEREVEQQIKEALEDQRITEDIYKQELSKWYMRRKEEYDLHVLNEKQTKEEKKKIIDRKMKKAQDEKERKKALREAQLQKLEDERIERWIKEWEIKIQEMGVKRRQTCKNCLVLPETPEEIELKKDLQKRIKGHIKEVLRKADKQKIPMEIPEAFEIATQEIIEEEVQAAMEAGKLQMKAEAEFLEREERKKKQLQSAREVEEKNRKKLWAISTLQKYARAYLARVRVRFAAYKRYEKFFDITYHEYYYQDKKTKETFWEKPPSLGSYDLPMEDYWIVIPGKTSDGLPQPSITYYYNPSTWQQSWVKPFGTVSCDICQEEFAKIYYNEAGYDQTYHAGVYYCVPCFQLNKVQELIQQYHVHPRDIFFQEFNGGKNDAIYTDFLNLPVVDFYTYSLDVNPNLKASEEEEAQLRFEEEMESQRLGLGGGGSGSSRISAAGSICEHCFKRNSEYECLDCHLFYCDSCNRKEHKLAHMKKHNRVAIIRPEVPPLTSSNSFLKLPPIQKTLSSTYLESLQESNMYDSDEENRENNSMFPSLEGGEGEKKKKKKKKGKGKSKGKKKSAHKEVSEDENNVSTDYSLSVPEKTPKRKKKKKLDDAESSNTDTDFTPKKRKKKKSADGESSTNPKTKKKKSKENKENKDTDYSESELSSPERLKLPPIGRPNTTPAKFNPDSINSDPDSPFEPFERDTKSAGDIPNERKKKNKTKKSKKSDDDESFLSSNGEGKKKKKSKNKKAKIDGESSDNFSTATGEQHGKKKKKKSDSESVTTDNSEVKKKKKKKSSTPKKKKKGGGESESDSVYDASSLSESSYGNALTTIPEKKKKKKKKTNPDGSPVKRKKKKEKAEEIID